MYPKKTNDTKIFLYTIPAVIIFAIIYLIRGPVFEDDAYIFYRYATNWAAGYGPVFNIGEYVEGYSSLLWTLILTIGALLSFDLVKLAPVLNLFIGIMCLFLMSYICGLIQFSRPRLTAHRQVLMAIALPLFCALSYGFYYYGASGMDTLILSLVLLLCIISLYKSKNSGNYLAALPSLFLLNIVRAEGPLYAVVLLAVLVYFVFRERKNILNLHATSSTHKDVILGMKPLITTIAIFAVLTILLFAIRYSIYNEWIPATVSAKGYATYSIKKAILEGDFQAMKNFVRVTFSGLQYVAPVFFLGAWIPFAVLLWKENRNNILLYLIASSIAVNVFVSVWAGGDYMFFKRHFIPVLPLLIIFFAWSVDLLFHKYWKEGIFNKALLSMTGGVLLILWIWFWVQPSIFTKPYFTEKEKTVYLEEIGTLLRNIPVPTVLLSNMIGKISYHAGPKVYVRDILGLTNSHNAKYGDEWGFNWGRGACGRTDFTYSFTAPFDVFFYNSKNMHKKFISFCGDNPSFCTNYRFFKTDEWIRTGTYVIADIQHPVANALQDKFGAVPLEINENLEFFVSGYKSINSNRRSLPASTIYRDMVSKKNIADYFEADGIHFSNLGHEVVAGYLKDLIEDIRLPDHAGI